MKKAIAATALAAALAMPMAAVSATSAASWGVITKWWDSKGKEQFSGDTFKKKECWKAKNLFKSNADDCT